MQHDVLGGHAGRHVALEFDAQQLRHRHAHGPGDEGVRHVRGADAESHASQRAAVRRVGIGADHDLARQGVVLGHHGVGDSGDVAAVVAQRFLVGERAVHAQAVVRGEVALGLAHGPHVGHEAGAKVRGALVHVRGVVLEHHDGLRLVQCQRTAERAVQQVGGHAGVVLVDEAPVRAHEGAFARLRVRGGDGRGQQMPVDDLLEKRAGPRAGGRDRRTRLAQMCLPEAQHAATAQDAGREVVAPGQQFFQWDFLARAGCALRAQDRWR